MFESNINMDVSDIEVLYSPSKFCKRYPPDAVLENCLKVFQKGTDIVLQSVPHELNIPYGPGEKQKLDVFGIDLPLGSPVFIFIHGGYWQTKEIKRENCNLFMAPLYKNGIKGIVVGYDLCPDVTLQEIVQEIHAGIKKSLEYALKWQSKNVMICGHSVGAHLTAELFQTFYDELPDEEQKILKTVFLISGIYNLVPLVRTPYNEALKLTEESAKLLSPLLQEFRTPPGVKFHVVVGENDSPKFVEESQLYYGRIFKHGANAILSVLPEIDHFDVFENLADENFEVTKLILKSA